jgi:hypothetical protein
MSKRALRLAFFLQIPVLLLATLSYIPAQTINGIFHGTITDASGAVVPGVTIRITNLATNAIREAQSNEAGFYTITELPPGNYSFAASKTGFTMEVRPSVVLLVNENLEVNFTLRVGSVTQQVQITGTPPQLDTATATVGQVVNAQQVVDLPLNGRQFTQLVLLTPGAEPIEGSQQSAYTISIGGGGVSPGVNGQRPQQNNFTMDGILNNEIFVDIWTISPPPDAIQEFNVQTHIVDARFSISSGANVNVVTKSGSNHLHGDVWEFLRNDIFDGTNFFSNYANQPKPPYRMNQYGFTVGGPVQLPRWDGRLKKTYFFGDWEGFRSRQSSTQFADVPTSAELGGNFSDILTTTAVGTDDLGRTMYKGAIYDPQSTRQVTAGTVDPSTGLTATSSGLVRDPFPGNKIPSARLDKAALTYLNAFYPSANYGTGGFPNFAGPGDLKINDDQFEAKIDQTFRNNDTLNGAFYFNQANEIQPTPMKIGAEILPNHGREVALGYTHLFSPSFLMTLHYGYSNSNYGYYDIPGGTTLLDAINAEGIEPSKNNFAQVPLISLAPRLTGTAQGQYPFGPIDTHEITADFQKVTGNHTFGAGLMYYKLHSYDDGWSVTTAFDQYPSSGLTAGNVNVTSTGDGEASMLLDLPSSVTPWVGNTGADLRTLWQGYYIQDQWRATKRLTFQAGLRYDFVASPHWLNNQISDFSWECECFLIAQPLPPEFPFANVRPTLFDPMYHGFQPRFGLNYQINSKTVLRTAFAVFDDHDNNLIQQTQGPRLKWPWAVAYATGGLNRGIPQSEWYWDNLPSAASFLPSSTNPGTPITSFGADPRDRIPYSMEWNFGIERAFTSNLTGSIQYVGSGSHHMYITPITNTPYLSEMGPGAIDPKEPVPEFGQINYIYDAGNGAYDSLQLKLEQRTSKGLYFLGSYTWSHCGDTASTGESAGEIQSWWFIEQNYGDCDFNMPQVFVFSGVYQLPVGRGRYFGSNWGRTADALLGGWQTSGIFTGETGTPFSVAISGDVANVNGGQQRAELVGDPHSGYSQSIAEYYNKTAFAVPASYTFGNAGRNILRGPNLKNLDFSLLKNYSFTESKTLQVRGDFFNISNTPHFGTPNATVNGANFMQILSAGNPRYIQLSLKFLF